MSAPRNFIGGFNHNIRYQGQVFHVQTEDSGEPTSVVKTHLFLGGTIIATRKISYGAARGAADLAARVRSLMEEQHKQVLRDLLAGRFDDDLRHVIAFQPGELGEKRQQDLPEEVDLDDFLDDILIEEVVVEQQPAATPAPATMAAEPVVMQRASGMSATAHLPATAHLQHPAPAPQPDRTPSAFGDGLVSDRSLDEVILAYLSGDE